MGREAELEGLAHALERAKEGRGGVVLLAGEAGIGKSRLAEGVAERAQEGGMAVAWGRCSEAGGAPAYWPWIQILRALEARDPAAPWLQPYRDALTVLVPEWRSPADPPELRLSAEQARFVLLDRLCAALCAAARTFPCVLVLEDLHVADAGSVAVLDLLCLQARTVPLLLVGTFRDAAVYEAHAALLRLSHQCQTFSLCPLEVGHVRRYLEEALGPALAREAERVHALCEGNPLVLVETARLLRRSGAAVLGDSRSALQGGLDAVLRERLRIVSPQARDVLAKMSAWGREVARADLLRMDAVPAEVVEAALREAVQAAVLVELEGERLRFSHILTREVLYRDLPVAERERLHRGVARLLEARHAGAYADAGYHWRRAGEDARADALRVTRAEARAAMQLYAFDLAARRFAQVAELHARVHPDDVEGLAEAWLELGRAELHAGRTASGRAFCLRAAEVHRRREHAEGLAEAALAYGQIMQFAQVDPVLVALLEEADMRLGDTVCPLKARVLARWAAALQPSEDARHSVALAQRAIAMARTLHDDFLLLDVLRTAAAALIDVVDAHVSRPIHIEHAALAARSGQTEHALRAHTRLAFDEFYRGEMAEAHRHVRQAMHAAAVLAHPLFSWHAPALRAMLALYEGRADVARLALEEIEAMDRAQPHANRSIALRFQRARWARLVDDTALHREMVAGFHHAFSATSAARALGRVFVAMEVLFDGADETPEVELTAAEIEAVLAVGDHTSLPWLAEIAWRRRDARLAARIDARLRTLRHLHTSTGLMTMLWEGPVASPLALCAAARGDLDEADALFHDALELALRHDAHPVAARVVLAWLRIHIGETTRSRPAALVAASAEVSSWRAEPAVLRHIQRLTAALPTAPVPRAASPMTFALRPCGEQWQLTCDGETFVLRDSKGMRWLAELLTHPGREFHVLTLATDGAETLDDGDAGTLLDARAVAAYRQRIAAIDERIEDLAPLGDADALARLHEEREAIAAQLAAGFGLGGRARRSGGAAEKARINVQKRLKDAISRIAKAHPRLGEHLRRAVRTGLFCVYDPDLPQARAAVVAGPNASGTIPRQ